MKIVKIRMDKERHLKFGMNATIQLEKDLGKPISQMGTSPSLEELSIIMFHGLKWEDKKLTLELVGDLFDEAVEHYGTFQEVVKLLMEAFSATFGEKNATPSKK